jgi:hypothetical protein
VPRITNKGLLVEEARTNSIRNNAAGGAVAGTPGTPPTNWIISTYSGVTSSIVGSGTDATGVDYVDIRWSGTAGSSPVGSRIVDFDSRSQVAASNGQVWAGFVFVRLVGGSLSGVSIIRAVAEFNSSGTFLASTSAAIAPPTTGWTSGAITRTNNNALTAFEMMFVAASWTSGNAIDFTLRFGWPQLELGTFATSPIRTTSAAVTRAADVVTVTTPPAVGSAYTLFGQATPKAPVTYAANQIALGVNDGTLNERSRIRRVATTGIGQGVTTTGGVDTVVASGIVSTQNISCRIAFAIANLDQAVSQNGSAIVTGAGALPSTPTVITIGTDQSTTLQYDGYVERVAIWAATRVSNASLQRITQ